MEQLELELASTRDATTAGAFSLSPPVDVQGGRWACWVGSGVISIRQPMKLGQPFFVRAGLWAIDLLSGLPSWHHWHGWHYLCPLLWCCGTHLQEPYATFKTSQCAVPSALSTHERRRELEQGAGRQGAGACVFVAGWKQARFLD